MKKLVLTNIQSGVRKLGAVKATLEHIQEAYMETIANLFTAFLAGTSLPVAVHGCVNSGSGSTYNISAGAIYHNGEMFEIDTFAGTAGGGQVPVLSLVTTWRAGDPVKYSDGSNYNTHTIRKYQWSFGASGSGLGDFSQIVSLKTRINDYFLDVDGQITSAVAALIGTAPGALDTLGEIADALNDDANLYTTLTGMINGKVAKAGDTMSGNLTIPDGTLAGHSVNKGQLDNGLAGKVAKTGDTMSGNLAIPDGTLAGHSVNKGQLDNGLAGKVAKTGDVVTGTIEVQGGVRTGNVGPFLKIKVIDIGDWNMDITPNKLVPHGLADQKKIRMIDVIIRNDADTNIFGFFHGNQSGAAGRDGGLEFPIGATNVELNRETSGYFDSASFVATGYNRGWVTILYDAS